MSCCKSKAWGLLFCAAGALPKPENVSQTADHVKLLRRAVTHFTHTRQPQNPHPNAAPDLGHQPDSRSAARGETSATGSTGHLDKPRI